MSDGKRSEVTRKCWEEMRGRAIKGTRLTKCERERREFFQERGMELVELKGTKEEGLLDFSKLQKRDTAKGGEIVEDRSL